MTDHSAEPSVPDDRSDALSRLRRRRLWQLLVLIGSGFGASLAMRLLLEQPINAPLLYLMIALVVSTSALALVHRHANMAAGLLLAGLTGVLLGMMLLGEGLRDEAAVGLPGVLVIAALLGNQRQLIVLAATMVASVAALGIADFNGWFVSPVIGAQPTSAIEIGVILTITAFGAALLAGDLAREVVLTQRSRAEAERLAHYDLPTGLPNRRLALDRFDHAARSAARSGERVALLLLDLDHFKDVNDALGHAFGDRLLAAVAQQLPPVLRGSDTVARLGGDEFLVILEGLPRASDAGEVARKLLDALAQIRSIGDTDVKVDGSIGIAVWPDDGGDFDTLRQKADIALYRAKEAGRQGFRFFDATMDRSVGDHLKLVSGLRRALHQRELHLHYQPQFELSTGRLRGAEALLRWDCPTQGRISPARFVPVAEQSGQIVEIGAWVLDQACRQAAAWRRNGLSDLTISVNLSPVQVRRGTLEQDVMTALERSGLDPSALELEFTESLLIADNEPLRALLARLRGLGVRFAIDDFGTGYSNLGYLQSFECQRLKIDQRFVRRMLANGNDAAIVRAIVQMAQALNLGVVAEGIEDAPTLARLRELGCDEGQGFYWSPGLPPGEFEAFARRRRGDAVDAAEALEAGSA